MHVGGGQQGGFFNDAGTQIGSTFWGNGSDAANGAWHKVEVYFKVDASAGIIRMWEDGVKVWEETNADTTLTTWTPFYIGSNWSGASGCCDHDANNHMYWDDFEVYSDTGTGANGLMSAATISSGSGSTGSAPQTAPNAPQNAQIIVVP
jgi:hypothetical protein